MRFRAVPRGTPDPDGDRRFAERPFPWLEPLAWTGERHRGGYGVEHPGDRTTALGLVFGPWDRFAARLRLEVTVGSAFPIAVTDEIAPSLFRAHLAAEREQLRSPDAWPRPARVRAAVEIDGAPVELDILRAGDRWLGQGAWRAFAVEIDAIGLQPADVRLRVAARLP